MRFVTIGFLAVVFGLGCSNFDHPIDWEPSSREDDLVGSWRGSNTADEPVLVTIEKNGETGLSFEWRELESDAGSSGASTDSDHWLFDGELLERDGIYVLQLAMHTLTEYDKKDELSSEPKQASYDFVLIVPDNKDFLAFWLNRDELATLSAQLANLGAMDSDVSIAAESYLECMDDHVASSSLVHLVNQMREDGIKVELSDEQEKELVQAVAKFENLKVDPYKEIRELQTCIALKLPTNTLSSLFENYADQIFTANMSRFAMVE